MLGRVRRMLRGGVGVAVGEEEAEEEVVEGAEEGVAEAEGGSSGTFLTSHLFISLMFCNAFTIHTHTLPFFPLEMNV